MAKLIIPPRNALKAFKEGKADRTDWFNISFRLRMGTYLAEKIYTEETLVGMKLAFDACLSIHTRFMTENVVKATPEELIELEAGLDAIDIMQTENLRRDFLDAALAARKELSDLLKINI